MKFWSQIGLLLHKIWLMKKRRPLGTIFEIFFPVALCSLLIYVRDEIEIEVEPRSYGLSFPVISMFSEISLPTTITNQEVCYEDEIIAYIGIAPNTSEVHSFLEELEEYYEYMLSTSVLDYYDWDYFSSDPDNFRDLLRLVDTATGDNLESTLEDLGIDIYDNDAIEFIIEILNLTIFSLDSSDFEQFYEFLTEFEIDDALDSLNNLTITFNVSDPDTIAQINEFLNGTTVGEFLSFFNTTLDEVESLFGFNDTGITANTSVTSLLNDISEALFNVTFNQVLSVIDFEIEVTECYNTTNMSSLWQGVNDTQIGVVSINNKTGIATVCYNDTLDIYEVTVNVQEFLTIYYDLLTDSNATSIDLNDIDIATLYQLLNDSLTEEIIEDAFGINITQSDLDDLQEFVDLNGNLTIVQLWEDITEIVADFSFLEIIYGIGNWSNLTSEQIQEAALELIEDTLGVDVDTASLLLEYLEDPERPSCLGGNTSNTFQDIFIFFDSSQEMGDYTQSSNYASSSKPSLRCGIVFNELNLTSMKFDYTLRFNQTDVTSTTEPYVDKYGRSPTWLTYESLWDYYDSGFLGWQNAIDNTILRHVNYDIAKDYKYGIHQFPFEPYNDDDFWTVIKRLLPMFLIISFSYPFCIICKTIVEEKSLRLKEGFKILGGSNTAYLLSYVFAYTVIFSITVVFLTMLLSGVFKKTDPTVLFVLFELFGLNMIALSMLISSLFDQPKLSSVIAWVSFLVLFFLYRFVEESYSESSKNAVCISGPACFGLALLQVAEYEEYEIGMVWSNVSEYNELTYFRLSTAMWWMSFDFFLYLFLMFYCDRVFPSKYGVRRPFYKPFAFMDKWFDKCNGGNSSDNKSQSIFDKSAKMHKDMIAHNIEQVDTNLVGQPIVDIQQLTKVYETDNDSHRIAVNKLDLQFYQNQVFVLLGPNGAGKSTTCSMLTGLTSVTSGDAIINGYSVVNELHSAREQIGLCPQHDLLFPRLTVWEHLQFYGKLNGMYGKELNDLCHDLLNKIQLDSKIHYQSDQLSGGQKRKLSVCIALIGRTSVVILDEPSSGMDPYARRRTWELIREYKQNRVIILTTHYMDEAEVLGDRIGIMAHGRLMCCGSPLFLKQNYNVGYALTLSLTHPCTVSDVDFLIQELRKQLNDDSVRLIGYAANEIVFRISFDNNPKLPSLFRYLDSHKKELSFTKYGISATTLEEVFRMINTSKIFDKQEESMSVSHTFENNSSQNSSDIMGVTKPQSGKYQAVRLSETQSKQQGGISGITGDANVGTTKKQHSIGSVSHSRHRDESATDTEETAKLNKGDKNNTTSTDGGSGAGSGAASLEMQDINGNGTTSGIGSDAASGATTPRNDTDKKENDGEPQRRASFLDGYEAVQKNEFLAEFYSDANDSLAANLHSLTMYEIFVKHVKSIIWKRYKNARRDPKTFTCQIFIPALFIMFGLWFIDFTWWESQPDYVFNSQDWIEDATLVTNSDDSYKLVIPFNYYNNESTRTSFYQNGTFETLLNYYQNIDDSDNYNNPTYQSYLGIYNVTPYPTDVDLPEWQDLLYRIRFDNLTSHYVSLYGMQFLDPTLLMIGCNASAFHAIPTGINLATKTMIKQLMLENAGYSDINDLDEITMNATIMEIVENADVITSSHPFERTQTQDELVDSVNAFFTAIILAIGLSFVPAAYVSLLVNERTNMVKHQQLVSGMSLVAYWIGNFIYDLIAMIMPAVCLILLIWIFDSTVFIGEAHFCTFLLTMTYGAAIIPFTYLLTFFFKSPGSAQALMLLLYLAAGVIMMIAAWIMDVIDDTDLNNTNKTLKVIYRFFPSFCMSEGFRGISTRDVTFLWGKELSVWNWEVTGRDFTLLAVQCVGYLLLVMLIDFMAKSPMIIKWINGNGLHLNEYKGSYELKESELDSDVLEEQKRLKNKGSGNNGNGQDPIELHGLRKVYSGAWDRPPTVAVQDLWFSVKKGEIFGFLGLNGAGKSTTLSMLSGVFPSNFGVAYLNGLNINSQQQSIRRLLGFCPQFSALFERLTVKEHLIFYSQVKGLKQGNRLDEVITILMKDLSLYMYRDVPAGKLSGGNQRKLSVGIALIGNPPIVLMDEPSSGMDPVSRRLLWDFISNTMSGRSVILTTHSMEECEALCNRVGIMVNGQLACLGDSTHLKNKFGVGYQLDIKYKVDISGQNSIDENKESSMNEQNDQMNSKMNNKLDKTKNELSKIFGNNNVELIENYGHSARFQVGQNESIGDIFEYVESIKQDCFIDSYAVSQTSLEQIFVKFAKKQADESANDKKNKNDNRSCMERGIACGLSVCVVD